MRNVRLLFCLVLILTLQQDVFATEEWHKVFNKPYVQTLENTPFGLLVGEYDTRLSSGPFNGIYITKDFGASFSELGLRNRGVTDIAYGDDRVFAGTYYVVNGTVGVFVSKDRGVTWEHFGHNFSVTSVCAEGDTIYTGTYSNGLWVSSNGGQSWTQKLGDGWFGPKVETIFSGKGIALASTQSESYISKDYGVTWKNITALKGKYIRYYAEDGNNVIAGTYSLDGLYLSEDRGDTWQKLNSFGTVDVAGLAYYDNTFFAGKKSGSTGYYTIFKTPDLGKTWEDTGLIPIGIGRITDIRWVYSKPWMLFASVSGDGIYKYYVNKDSAGTGNFIRPWKGAQTGPLIDYISAFFDHSYPLLAYGAYSEPAGESGTTVNFLGIRDSQPNLYYSTHDGTDFALPYGTEVTSVADGVAHYYYCGDCGNSIYIEHPGGLQTRYMHLQKDGLVATTQPVNVIKGQVLGKVGLTGRTTGPHLHFSMVKDVNQNGRYDDDSPWGKSDPFGWLTDDYSDPWSGYTWTDANGTHKGTSSEYQWEEYANLSYSTAPANIRVPVNLGNTTASIAPSDKEGPITIELFDYSVPNLGSIYKSFSYFPDTSTVINAYNQIGEKVRQFINPVRIGFNLNTGILEDFKLGSLKIYFWDTVNKIWEPLESVINYESGAISAETYHLTQFAVLGEKKDDIYPLTIISLEGDNENGWYTSYPLVNFSAYDDNGIEKTLYSLDSGSLWHEFTEPFYLEKEKISSVMYKSLDINGNMEETNEIIIKVDTMNSLKDRLIISGSTFTVNFP